MEGFTNEEHERINKLYGTDFKDITPEDAKLIVRYEAYKTSRERELSEEHAAIIADVEEKKVLAREVAENAMASIEELKVAALARLENIENG